MATSTKRQSYVAPVWRGLEHNIPIATGKPIAQVAEDLGIMSQAEMQKLLVAERLTQAGAITSDK